MAERHPGDANLSFSDTGDGAPLVLLHGFPLSGRMWIAQKSLAVSTGMRVIIPDLPGFGASLSSGAFTIDSLADVVHEFLATIDALPCVLAGLSMGGYIALSFATRYSKSLTKLALVDTRAAADTADGKANRNKMIELVRASGPSAIADQMVPKLVGATTADQSPGIVAQVRAMAESTSALTIEQALLAMRDRPDRVAELPGIFQPTLVIVGEEDVITPPAEARAMVAALPNATLAVIPKAGHMSPMEQPEAVNAVIAGWLTLRGA